jgi:hypothetical protein
MQIDTITTLDYWMIVPLFLLGSILHFTYDWSKHDKRVAIFSAVNESYWEHIKIAFWPVLLLALVEFAFGGHSHLSFLPAKTIALYSIPVSMIAFVFAYKRVTRKNVLLLDILAFLVSVALAQVISSLILTQLDANVWTVALSALFLLILVTSFALFTLHPPEEPDFFKDPITLDYGVKAHQ